MADPDERVRRVQERRRSNAAGKHRDKRKRRETKKKTIERAENE